MTTFMRTLALACLASCLFAVGASASPAVQTWVTTKPLPGVPCSVTGSLAVDYGAATMSYRGAVSCAGGVGQKTLDVVPQVYRSGPRRRQWFDLSLVGRYQGPTPVSPLTLSAGTKAVAGNIYRLLVYARVRTADRRSSSLTACAGCAGAPRSSSPSTLSVRPQSNFPAAPATTASLRGTPCFVSQDGLDFTLVNGTYVVNYDGFVACAGKRPAAHPSLRICAQVDAQSNGKTVWFTIKGSCLSARSDTSDTIALSTARTAFIGHGYRIIASGTVHYPTSHGIITTTATTHSLSAGP